MNIISYSIKVNFNFKVEIQPFLLCQECIILRTTTSPLPQFGGWGGLLIFLWIWGKTTSLTLNCFHSFFSKSSFISPEKSFIFPIQREKNYKVFKIMFTPAFLWRIRIPVLNLFEYFVHSCFLKVWLLWVRTWSWTWTTTGSWWSPTTGQPPRLISSLRMR